jgi:hypothetical protein
VTVEDRVFLGPNCSLTNDMRPRSKRDWSPVATTIREGATIGANATIVCGCDIGRYAFVGAGAVVTKPVPDHAVVFGSPARVHGYACECCQPLKGRGAMLACAKCGLTYVKTRDGVKRSETFVTAPKASRPAKTRAAKKTAPAPARPKRAAQGSARSRVAQGSSLAKTRRS